MLDQIKSQYESKKSLNKRRFYKAQLPADYHQMAGDIFPVMNEYFHELNPGYLHHLPKFDYFDMINLMTVRDGSALLGSFILKHFQSLGKLQTHFFIHHALAPLIPPNLKNNFSCWSIQQHTKKEISECKKVLIFGIASAQTLPGIEPLLTQLQELKKTSEFCQVEIYLPIRKSPLCPWTETFIHYELIEAIKSIIPHKKLHFVTLKEILERSIWNDIFFMDLLNDSLVSSDNFLGHFIANRGGTVSNFSAQADTHAQFELDLSLNHKIQFMPLPEVDSIFAEMIFYKKQAATKDYAFDVEFHQLFKKK